MQNKKILFTDLDGTLLNDQKLISAGNRRAINEALEAGHKVVIATGRPLPSAGLIVEDLGLTGEGCYAITYNGGLIYDCFKKEPVFKATLPLEDISHIFNMAEARHIHCQTYSDSHVIARKKTRELSHYCHAIRIPFIIDPKLEHLTADPVKAVMIDLKGKDRLMKIQEDMAAWCTGRLNCHFSSPTLLEFGPLEATKGNAVKYLCRHLDIPIENAVTAGDEENDISMLQAGGTGVVMANAPARVKEYGRYITKQDNNHDGIAEIIYDFIL